MLGLGGTKLWVFKRKKLPSEYCESDHTATKDQTSIIVMGGECSIRKAEVRTKVERVREFLEMFKADLTNELSLELVTMATI
jgi:hypothetical protein